MGLGMFTGGGGAGFFLDPICLKVCRSLPAVAPLSFAPGGYGGPGSAGVADVETD